MPERVNQHIEDSPEAAKYFPSGLNAKLNTVD